MEMTKSMRPKANPKRMAPAKSLRPKSGEEARMNATVERGNRNSQPDKMAKGGKVKKMAMGGSCRGMGAAKKGGQFRKDG